MLAKRLIKSNDAGGGGACTNTVDLYNPFPDGGGVALYQLNGDATDVSGNYDGTWSGTAAYTTGVFGQSANLSGSNYITMSGLTSFFTPKQTFTVSLWFKTSGSNVSRYLFSDEVFSFTNNYNITIAQGASGNFSIQTIYGGVGTGYATTTTYKDNAWHNIVVTINQSNQTGSVYIDGAFSGSYTLPVGTKTGTPYPVIGTVGNAYLPFIGQIDQVRIFSRALRPYEVEALYTEEYCKPTIVPSEHFNTVTYTGDGTLFVDNPNPITGVGFQPDFTWIKSRTSTLNHTLCDSVREAGNVLYPNLTNGEVTAATPIFIDSFDSDGFTVNALHGGNTNENGVDFVAWNFKAGGAAVENTDGTITSQVSANTEAGFSIVSYTTPTTNNFTVGHGLNDTPKIIIIKGRSLGSSWTVYSSEIGASNYLQLNSTNGSNASSLPFNNTAPTDSVFTAGSSTVWYGTNAQYIAYCFAEVEGFSSFGSYVGTGASGNTVVTGFEPAFVMLKSTSATGNWRMWDNKRTLQNPRNNVLIANGSNAEFTNDVAIEFLENGFSFLGSGSNDSGASFIYMAFAADPTTVEPSLEDSFNTVTWTGNQSTQSITGVGFQPDFTWIKGRDSAWYHLLYDSVRGANKELHSNTTDSEGSDVNILQSFDNDGFTLGSSGEGNWNGQGYVAWNWKGAELPAINSNGSIPSVVSANPAAGFSIVSYTNSTSGTADQRYTIGHGLDSAPDLIITKVRNVDGYRWTTYNSFNGTGQYMALNETRASTSFSRAFPVIPSSTVFTLDEAWPHPVNASVIAYCFHSVAGFSKFGSYTGVSSGVTVNVGFEPAFVMIKCYDNANSWVIGLIIKEQVLLLCFQTVLMQNIIHLVFHLHLQAQVFHFNASYCRFNVKSRWL